MGALASCIVGCTSSTDVQFAETNTNETPLTEKCVERTATSGGETVSMTVSRPFFFESEEEMANYCDTIIVGYVESQDEAFDTNEYIPDTRARVRVTKVEKGNATSGETVIVRQTGPIDLSVLDDGKTYLLYLNNFAVKDSQRLQYYISGVTAGAYELLEEGDAPCANSSEQFVRADKESGDNLPTLLSKPKTERE